MEFICVQVYLAFGVIVSIVYPIWRRHRVARVRTRLLNLDRTRPHLPSAPAASLDALRRAVDRLTGEIDDLPFWTLYFHPEVRVADGEPERDPSLRVFFEVIACSVLELYRIRYPVTFLLVRILKGQDRVENYARRITRYLSKNSVLPCVFGPNS